MDSPKPEPITNPATWVTGEDWPRELWKAEIEGDVGFVLDVDEQGLVTRCLISRTSGQAAMDEIVCQRMMERAQFSPALDDDGKPVASRYSSNVVFAFPDGQYTQPQPIPAEAKMVFTVGEDGKIYDCNVSGDEGFVARTGWKCPKTGPGSLTVFEPALDEEGNPVRVKITNTATVQVEPLAD